MLYWGPTTSDKGEVILYNPKTCDSDWPKVFCSVVVAATDEKCSKYQGAAIVCGDTTSKSVDGILLNNGGCEQNGAPPSFKLNYHSIGEYSDWIKKVSGAEDVKQISFILMTAAILVAIKNLVY